jgi:hypothetical protein
MSVPMSRRWPQAGGEGALRRPSLLLRRRVGIGHSSLALLTAASSPRAASLLVAVADVPATRHTPNPSHTPTRRSFQCQEQPANHPLPQ